MQYNFDELIPRRNTESIKWNKFNDETLPFWVADMDFRSPQPVIDALVNRVHHGVFGYSSENEALKELICTRLENLYQWKVSPEEVIFLPGVVNGFNLLIHALTNPGDAVLMQTPVYPPFLSAPNNAQAITNEATLITDTQLHYYVDFDIFRNNINQNTKLFMLCNPHNPVGRVFSKNELSQMAEISLNNGLYICSDEIHADLIFPGNKHIPIASLSPEIAKNTITLMAPSKTFNIAGLGFSFAIVQNADLKRKLKHARKGLISEINLLGVTAAYAAYQEGQEWLDQLLVYLYENWKTMVKFIDENIPGLKVTPIEGTYLAWFDCRELNLNKRPYDFFLENARVAFNDGRIFGTGGDGFIRFNFGCPKSVMLEGLNRMKITLKSFHIKK